MKRIFLLLVVAACGGGTTTDTDAGNTGDAGNDVVAKDAAPSDGAPSDAAATDSSSNDGATTGDGGLGTGDTCDPQNNQCSSGLLCCSEPTHNGDAATGFFCEKPINNGCPLLP
jgi:hypothetical protein